MDHLNLISSQGHTTAAPLAEDRDLLRVLAERLPRPLRFLCVGGLGLLTDVGMFTFALMNGVHPLAARVLSLAIATVVTWRLNRALTFDRSRHHQRGEAMRYLTVTATAQGLSYAIFATLAMTVLHRHPQVAILIGAAIGAVISYNGHRLLAFAPRHDASRAQHRPS